MSRVTLSCLAFLLVAGCESRQESPRGSSRTSVPTFEAAAPTKFHPIIDTPSPAVVDRPELPREELKAREDKRDLAVELQRAVGAPIDCLSDFESSIPTKIQIPISATVRPTGMVIQPTVSGVGLSTSARECIERRMTFIKLSPLDEPFSQTVSTFVQVDYAPQVIVEADPVPEPKMKNVVEPLPTRAELPPSGRPIESEQSRPIKKAESEEPSGPSGKPVEGPKPRPIDGYEVDENAQQWR